MIIKSARLVRARVLRHELLGGLHVDGVHALDEHAVPAGCARADGHVLRISRVYSCPRMCVTLAKG